jgi:hypothetical protein
MFEFEIGGNEVKPEASEGINSIAFNRSLLALQLTNTEPTSPRMVEKLKTVEEVFAEFKPTVEVEFEDDKGASVKEALHFSKLSDFRVNSMIENSDYLSALAGQQQEYDLIIKRLLSHRSMQTALDNPQAKAALVDTLKALAAELS